MLIALDTNAGCARIREPWYQLLRSIGRRNQESVLRLSRMLSAHMA